MRKAVRGLRASQGLQTSFLGRPISLPSVASHTASDDILPALVPSPGHRNNVVIGELAGLKSVPAILTAIMISRIDIGTREPYLVVVPLHLDVSKQSQD